MGAKLFFHLRIHLRTLEESGDAETKRVEESYNSSGSAAREEPMAVASRFHELRRMRSPIAFGAVAEHSASVAGGRWAVAVLAESPAAE
jgi:hypothetical protein